jgi:hypothetical protein
MELLMASLHDLPEPKPAKADRDRDQPLRFVRRRAERAVEAAE